MNAAPLSWFGIFRLGLVQTGLGAIVVLMTSTLNRVMVVEWALPAIVPGALVAWHYLIQMSRPRMGYGSDIGGRRTPWIIGGMAVLACGGLLAALSTALMGGHPYFGLTLAALAFALIGLGVGSAGTSLLVLLAGRVADGRRPAAAAVVWIMMIVGFAVTAGVAGAFLDPFSPLRLVTVTAVVCGIAFLLALVGIIGIEKGPSTAPHAGEKPGFGEALREVCAEPAARRFTFFIFVSMLAYSAQDLILEPFAGHVFGLTPGESTSLSGVQHSGVLLGMIAVAVLAGIGRKRTRGSVRAWATGGCVASAIALVGLAVGGLSGTGWPLSVNVFLLGLANGAFAVAAIGSMMQMVSKGTRGREGVRMGLWGAAQAVAFGLGGFLGTVAIDLSQWLLSSPAPAYALVFGLEALCFVFAALLFPKSVRAASDRELKPGTLLPLMGISVGKSS